MNSRDHQTKQTRTRERGYTLLEYCAGAAVICGVLWVAMSNLGGSVGGLLDSISAWVNSRNNEVQSNQGSN